MPLNLFQGCSKLGLGTFGTSSGTLVLPTALEIRSEDGSGTHWFSRCLAAGSPVPPSDFRVGAVLEIAELSMGNTVKYADIDPLAADLRIFDTFLEEIQDER